MQKIMEGPIDACDATNSMEKKEANDRQITSKSRSFFFVDIGYLVPCRPLGKRGRFLAAAEGHRRTGIPIMRNKEVRNSKEDAIRHGCNEERTRTIYVNSVTLGF